MSRTRVPHAVRTQQYVDRCREIDTIYQEAGTVHAPNIVLGKTHACTEDGTPLPLCTDPFAAIITQQMWKTNHDSKVICHKPLRQARTGTFKRWLLYGLSRCQCAPAMDASLPTMCLQSSLLRVRIVTSCVTCLKSVQGNLQRWGISGLPFRAHRPQTDKETKLQTPTTALVRSASNLG